MAAESNRVAELGGRRQLPLPPPVWVSWMAGTNLAWEVTGGSADNLQEEEGEDEDEDEDDGELEELREVCIAVEVEVACASRIEAA